MSIPEVIRLISDKLSLSDETGFTVSTLEIEFNVPVQEFKVKVLGVSHDTGIMAHREVKDIQNFNTNTVSEAKSLTVREIRQFEGILTAEVDYTELYQEGDNRVYVYGKSQDTKEWTIS